jgi:hypothetical protein
MTGDARFDRRAFLSVAAASAIGVGIGGSSAVLAQPNVREKKIEPQTLDLDQPGIWTLHFRYKPPRIVTLNGFSKDGKPAKQVVWYMWYQVYNLPPENEPAKPGEEKRDDKKQAGQPVTFLPEFELVTKDLLTSHLDEPQPFILSQLEKIENPQNHPNLRLLSTIEISKRPIPVTSPDSIPRVVTGVAVWTDMSDKAPKTNKFSVYVVGLSNGQATEQLRTGEKLIKRKTLQINFIRPTDDNNPQITDIRPDDTNAPAEQWIYRTSSVVKAIGVPKLPPP